MIMWYTCQMNIVKPTLKLEEPSRIMTKYGQERWSLMNGTAHRLDGPAITHKNGAKLWVKYGESHRLDGPAVERHDGSVAWWVNGRRYYNLETFLLAAGLSDDQVTILKLKYGNW